MIHTKLITPGKPLKNQPIRTSSNLPRTPGLEAIARSKVEPRPIAVGRKGSRTV